MRHVWDCYDAQDSGSKVFGFLISALKRLVTEKPALLGVGSQMGGVGISSGGSEHPTSTSVLDVGGMAGRVATAASATVSGVVGMMGGGGGLSLHGSAMKLQWCVECFVLRYTIKYTNVVLCRSIDQLDKADAPPIPDAYIYLLAVQCFVSLCEGLASFTGPLYTLLVIQKPRSAGEPVVRAPPALDLSTLSTITTDLQPHSQSQPQPASTPTLATSAQVSQLHTVRAIIEHGWPALLAALSFIIATNLSDELFVEVLSAFQALANVSGMLGLTTPRDAFLTSLAKFAVPSRIVSSLDTYVYSHAYGDVHGQTPRSTSSTLSLSENLGLGLGIGAGASTQGPGLSERNMACLKVFIGCAMFLAGSLGESWFSVLEVLQNADYVLTSKGAHQLALGGKRVTSAGVAAASLPSPPNRPQSMAGAPPSGSGGTSTSVSQARHPLMTDLDPDTLQNAIQRLFDASKNLEDGPFSHFVNALCKLSAEMVEMQSAASGGVGSVVQEWDSGAGSEDLALSPRSKRRVSGIHIPRTLVCLLYVYLGWC